MNTNLNTKSKRIVIGTIIALVVAVLLGTPVLAKNLSKTIEVFFKDIKIYVDGNLVTPKDASGRIVEPFISEGTTYLPVRAGHKNIR